MTAASTLRLHALVTSLRRTPSFSLQMQTTKRAGKLSKLHHLKVMSFTSECFVSNTDTDSGRQSSAEAATQHFLMSTSLGQCHSRDFQRLPLPPAGSRMHRAHAVGVCYIASNWVLSRTYTTHHDMHIARSHETHWRRVGTQLPSGTLRSMGLDLALSVSGSGPSMLHWGKRGRRPPPPPPPPRPHPPPPTPPKNPPPTPSSSFGCLVPEAQAEAGRVA